MWMPGASLLGGWDDLSLTVEQSLVCACVTWPLGTAECAAVERLAARITDWHDVQRLSERHRVTGMVSHALLLAARPRLPDAMRAWCQTQVDTAGLLELAAGGAAHGMITRLARAGIPARLLKGPAVSIAAFGQLGLRTNRDIDLLVDPTHRAEAAAIIEADGWRRIEPEHGLPAAGLAAWLRHHKDFAFLHSDGRMLELHWRLFNNHALLPGLDRCPAYSVRFGAFEFPTLPPVENLLYLCVHGAEHAWSRLKWLADAAALLRQMDASGLDALLQAARRNRVYPAVAQAILLSACYLGLPVKEALKRRLRRSFRARALARIAVHSLFEGGARELEEQRWGSTLKNIGHYFMADGPRFWLKEAHFDLMDMPAAGLPDQFRRFGPLARGVGLVLRLSRGRPRRVVKTVYHQKPERPRS